MENIFINETKCNWKHFLVNNIFLNIKTSKELKSATSTYYVPCNTIVGGVSDQIQPECLLCPKWDLVKSDINIL